MHFRKNENGIICIECIISRVKNTDWSKRDNKNQFRNLCGDVRPCGNIRLPLFNMERLALARLVPSFVITSYPLITENRDCFNRFRWYNIGNGALLTDAQEINVLELAKLPENDDGSKLWQWLKLLMLREENEMEEIAKENIAMKDVIVTLREMSSDEAERRLAEAREKEERDRRGAYISGEIAGEARGIEIGEARGIEIGEMRAKQENARQMKNRGYSTNEISDITGLSSEEIDNL